MRGIEDGEALVLVSTYGIIERILKNLLTSFDDDAIRARVGSQGSNTIKTGNYVTICLVRQNVQGQEELQ